MGCHIYTNAYKVQCCQNIEREYDSWRSKSSKWRVPTRLQNSRYRFFKWCFMTIASLIRCTGRFIFGKFSETSCFELLISMKYEGN